MADRRAGDGQSQGNSHQHRHRNAHPEGLEIRGPVDEIADIAGRLANGGSPPHGQGAAQENGHQGRHQQIDLGLLADQLTGLGGQDGDKQHRQRPSCPADGIGGIAYGRQREQHQRRRIQGIADGDGHGRAGHIPGKGADVDEQLEIELLTGSLNDGADEQ